MKVLFFLAILLFVMVVFDFSCITSSPSNLAQPPSAAFVHLSKTPTPTSPQPIPLQQNHQLNKIIDALIGAGDYAGWGNILSSTDSSTLPMTATLFIPSNDAIAKAVNSTGMFHPDTLLIPYHIVPKRLTFDDLRKYPVFSKLPTLLPTKFIVVTNDSAENFTVDGTRITHPDLYLTGLFSVHGVKEVLDYKVYGNSVETGNGTLMKNGTETRNRTTSGNPNEPGNGGTVSCGCWLDVDLLISVAVVFVVVSFISRREFTWWDCLMVAVLLAAIAYNTTFLDQ